MYLSPEAKELLATYPKPVDPQAVTEDPTGIVLADVANAFAKWQGQRVEALRQLGREADTLRTQDYMGGPLAGSTYVRLHDEAFYAMQALRGPLMAAVAAWTLAHTTETV